MLVILLLVATHSYSQQQFEITAEQDMPLTYSKLLGNFDTQNSVNCAAIFQQQSMSGVQGAFSILQSANSIYGSAGGKYSDLIKETFNANPFSKQTQFINACDKSMVDYAAGLSCPDDEPVFSVTGRKKGKKTADYDAKAKEMNAYLDGLNSCKDGKLAAAEAAMSCFKDRYNLLTDALKYAKVDFDNYTQKKQQQVVVIEKEIEKEQANTQVLDLETKKYMGVIAKIDDILPEKSMGEKSTMTIDRQIRSDFEKAKKDFNQNYRKMIREGVSRCMQSTPLSMLGLTNTSRNAENYGDDVLSKPGIDAAMLIFKKEREAYYFGQNYLRAQIDRQVAKEMATFQGNMLAYLDLADTEVINKMPTNVDPEVIMNTDPYNQFKDFSYTTSRAAPQYINSALKKCHAKSKEKYAESLKTEWETQLKETRSRFLPYLAQVNETQKMMEQLKIPPYTCAAAAGDSSKSHEQDLKCIETSVAGLRRYKNDFPITMTINGRQQSCNGLVACAEKLGTAKQTSETRAKNLETGKSISNDPICQFVQPCKGKDAYVKNANQTIETRFSDAGKEFQNRSKLISRQMESMQAEFTKLGIDLPNIHSTDKSKPKVCESKNEDGLCELTHPFEDTLRSASGLALDVNANTFGEIGKKVQAKKEQNSKELASAKEQVESKIQKCKDEKEKKDQSGLNKHKAALDKALRGCSNAVSPGDQKLLNLYDQREAAATTLRSTLLGQPELCATGPGSGKTFVPNVFYECLPVNGPYNKRVDDCMIEKVNFCKDMQGNEVTAYDLTVANKAIAAFWSTYTTGDYAGLDEKLKSLSGADYSKVQAVYSKEDTLNNFLSELCAHDSSVCESADDGSGYSKNVQCQKMIDDYITKYPEAIRTQLQKNKGKYPVKAIKTK